MASLYVIETGARVEVEYQRVIVTAEDETIFRAPIQHVSQVVLIGSAGVTTPALHKLLHAGIPLLFLDYRGRFLGRLQPAASYQLPLRLAQYQKNDDPEFCLRTARAIVCGKIKNQRTYLRRLAHRGAEISSSDLLEMKTGAAKAAQAGDLPGLLGVEGYTARIFFNGYRRAFNPEWNFTRRARRPPKDPVNAMLSLGYTLLNQAVIAAIEITGLDPYLGYFHVEKYGRPALALDLVEEFRTPIVDSLVYDMASHHRLTPEDFQNDTSGRATRLTRSGLRLFVKEFSRKMESEIKTRELDRSLSYQKHLEVQARKMARCIQGQETQYQPFQIR